MTEYPEGHPLHGMTWNRWQTLRPAERDAIRDTSGLNPELIPYEGKRIEARDRYGDVTRFWVGRSTGWRPCHLAIKRSDAHGGDPADVHTDTHTARNALT